MGKRRFQLAYPDPTEDQLQESIASLFDRILPEDKVRWTHIAHGGYELTKAAQARLYRLGLKRGFPDIIICYGPGRVLWLEIKTPTGILSPAQKVIHLSLRAMGHCVVVVRKIEHVIAALIEYDVPFRSTWLDGEWYAKNVASEAPGAETRRAQGRVGNGAAPLQEIANAARQ